MLPRNFIQEITCKKPNKLSFTVLWAETDVKHNDRKHISYQKLDITHILL